MFAGTDTDEEVIHVNTRALWVLYALLLNKDPFELRGGCTAP